MSIAVVDAATVVDGRLRRAAAEIVAVAAPDA